jgi:HPt (histidine-containing phosphotransfer) domain-containing protein
MSHGTEVPSRGCVNSQAPEGTPGRRGISLICLETLRQLEDELGDDESSRTFVGTYVSMWEGRRDRLSHAVLAPDMEAGLEAVLSLKIASSMAGAHHLARLAEQLQELITRALRGLSSSQADAHPAGAVDLLSQLNDCGNATMEQLRLDYLERGVANSPAAADPA